MPSDFFTGLANDMTGGSEKAPEKDLAAAPVAADPSDQEGQTPEQALEAGTPEQGGNEADNASEQRWKVVVDGKEVEVPHSEVIARYQTEQHQSKRFNEIAEKEKAIKATESEVQKVREQYGQRLEALVKAQQPNLPTSEMMQKALQEGRTNDALMMQMAHTQFAALQQEQQRVAQETEAENSRQRAETEKSERSKLLEALPEWKTDHHGAKRVSDYLQGYGYSEDDLAGVLDHRHFVIAEKARRYDELQKNKPVAEQRVANVPQVGRPGARQESKAGKEAKVADLTKTIAQTGSSKALRSYFATVVQ